MGSENYQSYHFQSKIGLLGFYNLALPPIRECSFSSGGNLWDEVIVVMKKLGPM